MKTISAELDAHLAGETTTMATCWHITRRDLSVFAATDHDVDIVFDGVTYLASSGYTATDVETMADLNVDNMEVTGFSEANLIDAPSIDFDDVRAGLWDFADVRIFQVNYEDLTMGSISERCGKLGEISLDRGLFKAELRGLMQAFTRVIGRLDSPGCNANLGDSRCQVDMTIDGRTVTGTLEGVNSDTITLYDSGRTEPGPDGGVAITNVSNADPAVVTTATDHGFVSGESVNLSGIVGMEALNVLVVVRNPTDTTFELSIDTSDTAAYGTYGSGGTATPVGSSGFFDFGLLTLTTGLNAGFAREIKSYVPGQFTLHIPFPYLVAPGDLYIATAGCGKSLTEDCKDRFDNVINFRGFPYLPGTDKLVQVARHQ